MRRFALLILLFAFCMTALTVVGCGDDDDDDDTIASDDDDDTVDDDDDTTDDDDDDDVTDDDDDDDITDDDDDDDIVDPDTEYAPVVCQNPDPEGIGATNHVGGGSISNLVTAYVWDDLTCQPIAGATVVSAGVEYTTDANGKAEIPFSKGEEMITAFAEGYGAWTYKADAAVMYFRLRAIHTGIVYDTSSPFDFYSGGYAFDLDNPNIYGLPNIMDLLNYPIYLGAGYGGLTRQQMLSVDIDSLVNMEDTYRIDIDVNGHLYYLAFPQNVYAPYFSISNLFNINLSMLDHSYYMFEMDPTGTDFPVSGLLLSVDLGEVLDLQNLQGILQGIVAGQDISALLLGLIPDLINSGITVANAGSVPTWDGAGDPMLELHKTSQVQDSFDVTITNGVASSDYLGTVLADIPNRTLTPTSLSMEQSGSMTLYSADIPDADYILTGIKTDLIESDFFNSNLSFVFRYGLLNDTWKDGVTFDDADFLPYFNDYLTEYDWTTKTVSWQLLNNGTADAYLVAILPSDHNAPTILAMLPGNVNQYTVPSEVDFNAALEDVAIVLALDLPDDVDLNQWSPIHFWQKDVEAMSLWMQPSIIEQLSNFFTKK